MQVQRVKSANQTVFGTRFGPKLTKFLEKNKETLSNENFRNLSNIRNNGINSVLELEDASFMDKKSHNYKYKLSLSGPIINTKNYIMNWDDYLYKMFQDYINGSINGHAVANNKIFPVYIKDLKEDTLFSVLKKFNDDFGLLDKIEEEIKQSKIIIDEFKNFKHNWMNTLRTNK